MKQFVKMLLVFLGVMLLSLSNQLWGQWSTGLKIATNGVYSLDDIPDDPDDDPSIAVVLDTLRNPILRLTSSSPIQGFESPMSNIEFKNGEIHIKKGGTDYGMTVWINGKSRSLSIFVHYIAKLFQGDKDKVDRAEAPLVRRNEIRITSNTNLNEVVGVPSGYFTSSWWCIEHDTQYHVVWKKVSSVSLGELLSESKKRYPNQNSWKIFIEMSDGTFNHDRETKELFGRTNIAITLIDERTPVVETHDVTIAPLQNGRIIATPNKAKPGEEVTVEVTPNSGYRLKEGSLKIEAAGKQYPISNRFEMPNTDVTISAEFERISHQVQLYFRNIGEGSVKCWVGDSAREVTSGSLVNAGEMVVFRAEPSSGWKFVCWRDLAGNEYSTDSEIRFIMPYGEPGYYAMVTAEFQQITAILEIEAPKIMLSKQEIFVPGAKFLELYDLQGRLLLENPSSRLIWSGHSGIFMLRIDRKKVEKVLLE